MNPDRTARPVALQESAEPEYDIPDDDTLFDKASYEVYRARMELYKVKLAKYERQKEAFGELISFAQVTTTAHNVTFIQKEEPHLWNILRALKRRFAPSDETRSLEIEQEYHKLCKGPGTWKFESWSDEWTISVIETTGHGITEATGSGPVRDILLAIRTNEPSFADARLVLLKHLGSDGLHVLVKGFRQHLRRQQLQGPS